MTTSSWLPNWQTSFQYFPVGSNVTMTHFLIQSQQTTDLLSYYDAAKPGPFAVTDGSREEQAWELVRLMREHFPWLAITFRHYGSAGEHPDNGIHRLLSPKQFFEQRVVPRLDKLLKYGCLFHTDNESTREDMWVYSDWQAELIRLCYPEGLPLGVGTVSVATPDIPVYPQLYSMFHAIATHPGCVWKPNAGIGQTQALTNSLPDHWHHGLVWLRDVKGLDPRLIPVINNEFALSYTTFNHDTGRPEVDAHKGWLSQPLKDLGWTAEKYADEVYQNVIAWVWGPWGGMSQMFHDALEEGDYWSYALKKPFWDRMAQHAKDWWKAHPLPPTSPAPLPIPVPPPTPTPEPPTSPAETFRVFIPTAYVNARQGADTNKPIVTQVFHGQPVKLIEYQKTPAPGWFHVQIPVEDGDPKHGWINDQGGKIELRPVDIADLDESIKKAILNEWQRLLDVFVSTLTQMEVIEAGIQTNAGGLLALTQQLREKLLGVRARLETVMQEDSDE